MRGPGYLFNDTTGEVSPLFFDMVGSEQAPADPDLALLGRPPPFDPTLEYAEMTMTMSYTFSVDSGALNTYGIALKVIPTNDPTVDDTDSLTTGWAASLQTLYVPFDANGQNPPGFSTQGKSLPRNPRLPDQLTNSHRGHQRAPSLRGGALLCPAGCAGSLRDGGRGRAPRADRPRNWRSASRAGWLAFRGAWRSRPSASRSAGTTAIGAPSRPRRRRRPESARSPRR